jgi:CNT family concentrative nucleoside transporter
MADIPREHNVSPMHGVVENTDPVLDVSHEHHHAHLHHSAFSEKGRHDDIAYSKGTTAEPHVIPDADPMDNALHRRKHPERGEKDIEKIGGFGTDDMDKDSMNHVGGSGEDEGHRGHAAGFYAKYKIYFHIFIAMLFTG